MQRLFVIASLLFCIFFQEGCKKDTGRVNFTPAAPVVPPPVVPPPGNPAKRYLALGDSYTIGQGVAPADRFPVQTKTWLVANGVDSLSYPEIIATTGWTTANLQSAITSQNPAGPYELVSLLIGVNDQYQHQDKDGYRTRFTQLLQKSISLAGNKPSHVFVLSIPDYSVTPFAQFSDTAAIRREIDEFNEINRQVSASFNVQYLEITNSTREARTNPNLLAADGLHPSGIEYNRWAVRLGPMMKELFQ